MSRAFRRGIGFLAALVILTGCSSAMKQQYLRHLEVTIAPTSGDGEVLATVERTTMVDAGGPNNPRP